VLWSLDATGKSSLRKGGQRAEGLTLGSGTGGAKGSAGLNNPSRIYGYASREGNKGRRRVLDREIWERGEISGGRVNRRERQMSERARHQRRNSEKRAVKGLIRREKKPVSRILGLHIENSGRDMP